MESKHKLNIAAFGLRFFFVFLPLHFSKDILMKKLIKLLVCLSLFLPTEAVGKALPYSRHIDNVILIFRQIAK